MYSPFSAHSWLASAVSTGATASGVIRARTASKDIPLDVIWVSAYGSSMLVSTPWPAPSAASDRPNASRPPLLAAYADSPMSPCSPPVDATRMIRPYPAGRITAIAARASRMLPSRLIARTSSKTGAGCLWNIPPTPIAALATQMSSRPHLSSAAPTIASPLSTRAASE